MIVKIGKDVYKATEVPIILILTQQDKDNIANMHESAVVYCAYPSTMTAEDVEKLQIDAVLTEYTKPQTG